MLVICYGDLFVMVIYCYVIYLICVLFDMHLVCYASSLLCSICTIFVMHTFLLCYLFVMLVVAVFWYALFLLCCETLCYALVNLFVIQLVDVFCGMLVLFMV